MSRKITAGIVGYGNLGRGVRAAIEKTPDMELFAIFTRRDPESIHLDDPHVRVLHVDDAPKYAADIDVMLLCGGSASDLWQQGPQFARLFNTVDSFDTHAKIPEYYNLMSAATRESGKIGIISAGWDPGLFSLNRLLMEAVIPDGKTYTFYGKGVSQGHSDAIRRIDGVKDAIQYTVPVKEALDNVRQGRYPDLKPVDMHLRDCYVVAEEGADKARIESTIKNMPDYFAGYETRVAFITEEEMKKNHVSKPHGGFVIRGGNTVGENEHSIEFSLKLESNPEFTGSVLTAYARAAYRLNQEGQSGVKTVFDIPPVYLSYKPAELLRKELL
ncbi:MAG: diaminopimelate dehydrogenase [Bacillota bacterium]|nr:diaminopimelate dehydrogenase [Bacillota bacterium]